MSRRAILGVMAGLLLCGLVAWGAGIRINTTRSVALGVYLRTDAPVTVGSYVLVCPPESEVFATAFARGYLGAGYCPGGYGPMLKRVLAAKGATVDVSDLGLAVDGQLVPGTALLAVDPSGRAMPRYAVNHYGLAEDQVLLVGDDNPRSFDSRYYGPVGLAQVRAVMRPIVTW